MGIELFVVSNASVTVGANKTQLLHQDYLSLSGKQLMIDAGCHCATWAVAAPHGHIPADGEAYFIRGWRMIGPLMRAIDYIAERNDRFINDSNVHLGNRERTDVTLGFVRRYFNAVYDNPNAYVVLRLS